MILSVYHNLEEVTKNNNYDIIKTPFSPRMLSVPAPLAVLIYGAGIGD
jgi:hypothetical protein